MTEDLEDCMRHSLRAWAHACGVNLPVDEISRDLAQAVKTRLMVDHTQREPANLPRKLTAENGAKAALIGEFHEDFGYLDDGGNERYIKVAVTWDTIKRIWDKAVEHFDAHPVAPAERATAWLIEWPENDVNPVRWWNPAHGWMRDANKAMHFARKTDADCFLSTMRFGLNLKVTEHIFIGEAATSRSPAESGNSQSLGISSGAIGSFRPQPALNQDAMDAEAARRRAQPVCSSKPEPRG